MTKVIYRTEVFVEGEHYVGLCPELGVSSFGETHEDAVGSLQEAVEAFLMECESDGALDEVLEESGFEGSGGTWKLRERVSENRVALIGPEDRETRISSSPKRKGSTDRLKSRHSVRVTRLSEEDIKRKLADFELRFGMTSREFIARYNACELREEKMEFLDWVWYYDAAADCGIVSTDLET